MHVDDEPIDDYVLVDNDDGDDDDDDDDNDDNMMKVMIVVAIIVMMVVMILLIMITIIMTSHCCDAIRSPSIPFLLLRVRVSMMMSMMVTEPMVSRHALTAAPLVCRLFRQLRSHMGRKHKAAGCRPHWSHGGSECSGLRR